MCAICPRLRGGGPHRSDPGKPKKVLLLTLISCFFILTPVNSIIPYAHFLLSTALPSQFFIPYRFLTLIPSFQLPTFYSPFRFLYKFNLRYFIVPLKYSHCIHSFLILYKILLFSLALSLSRSLENPNRL
jgi:hypothetical protein